MQENPLPVVSVVIPVRNGEAFVGSAIESVLSQDGVIPEVIVVDNASTDATVEVLSRFGSAITTIREEARGAARARNSGVRMAHGRYLAFLDADDLWIPGKLARQLAVLATDPAVGLVFGHAQDFSDGGSTPLEMRADPYPCLSASTLFCKRQTFLQIGELPETSGGEFVAWCGWAAALGIGGRVMPEVLVKRRIHDANSSRDPSTKGGYIAAAKWLLDRRRSLQETAAKKAAQAGTA